MMGSMPVGLAAIKDRLGPLGFAVVRGLERRLSPSGLYSVLAPLAFTRAAVGRIDPLPGYFSRSIPAPTMREARANYFLSRILEFFPDRLATPKWRGCFRTSGFHHIQEARKEGRSVVLVCFHFGTFKLMPFWLRALGIPAVALLRGKSQDRSRAKRMKDRLSPFPKLPTVFYTDDQLRTVIEFLASGHALMVAADRETRRQITVPIDDRWSFRMATGAFRLASRCNAELIPVCMTDEGRWHFWLEISQPVPREYLTDGSDMMRAGQYLLHEMLPRMQQHPEYCTNYLLNCFQQNAAIPVAESY
jgi:lauroyl/myristoyl acyltransferase